MAATGSWRVEQVQGRDLDLLLARRGSIFRSGRGVDRDAQDAHCRHFAVFSPKEMVAGLRLRLFANGDALKDSYAAAFYGLAPLSGDRRPLMEVGRVFVTSTSLAESTVAIRLAWDTVKSMARAERVGRLIGCTSLPGADPWRHVGTLAQLSAHVGPVDQVPRRIASQTLDLGTEVVKAMPLPGLLRAYLSLGAWVGDHAVIDNDLGTIHVFTCLDLDRPFRP